MGRKLRALMVCLVSLGCVGPVWTRVRCGAGQAPYYSFTGAEDVFVRCVEVPADLNKPCSTKKECQVTCLPKEVQHERLEAEKKCSWPNQYTQVCPGITGRCVQEGEYGYEITLKDTMNVRTFE